MSTKTIVKNATKYFLAVLVTVYMWQFAGSLLSAKNDIANIVGYSFYFGMAIGWFSLLKHDVEVIITRWRNY